MNPRRATPRRCWPGCDRPVLPGVPQATVRGTTSLPCPLFWPFFRQLGGPEDDEEIDCGAIRTDSPPAHRGPGITGDRAGAGLLAHQDARGTRWPEGLPGASAATDGQEAKSLKEIAAREGIDNSYVSRMVNLTTLAPDIVAAILDDALANHITLFDLAVDPPALWDEQRARVGL